MAGLESQGWSGRSLTGKRPLSVSETLAGSVQLPGVPHCRVLTHPDCLYTWDPWLLSEKPGHHTVPSPQRPAKPDCSEGEKPVDIFLS